MVGGYPRCDSEAEAAAARRRGGATYELTGDERDFVFRDPDTGIDHVDMDVTSDARGIEDESPIRTHVLDGVVDKIVKEQPQRKPVAFHIRDTGRDVQFELESGLIELRFKVLLNIVEDRRHGERFEGVRICDVRDP